MIDGDHAAGIPLSLAATLCMMLFSAAPAPSADPPTPDERRPIENHLEFFSDVAGWTIARTPLPEGEEVQRAAAEHARIADAAGIVPTPESTDAVFARLVREIPGRLEPEGGRFSLHVLDLAEPLVFAGGAGRVYVSRGRLTDAAAAANCDDGLAFDLAHALGHQCLGNVKRRYQLLWLRDQLNGRLDRKVESARVAALLQSSVDLTGRWLQFLYSDEEELKADLFAIHLCRNAGLDERACLQSFQQRLAAPAETEAERNRQDVERLKRRADELGREVEGRVDNSGYGLLRFDDATGATSPIADGEVRGGRVVVFVHGMDSDAVRFTPLAQSLNGDLDAEFLVFRYPNDGSLARMGRFLGHEVERVITEPAQVDFVGHSAGGLIVRWYAEVEDRPLRSAVMLGTPQSGSELAKLRTFIEALQFLKDLKLGFDDAVLRSLLDAKGQIGADLQPDSLFLRYLNRDREAEETVRERYAIARGRAMKPSTAAALKVSLIAGRRVLRKSLENKQADVPATLRTEAGRWIEKLRVPDEIARGDLAVALERAELKGVDDVETFSVHHVELLKDADVAAWVRRKLAERSE